MELFLQRRPTINTDRGLTTFGELLIGGRFYCLTLEDAIREQKVYAETAIPPGRYELRFRDSPKFGPDSIEIVNVPGYANVLIHAGNHIGDTLGCIIIGDSIRKSEGVISGGAVRGVLGRLKDRLRVAFRAKERVWLTISNPLAIRRPVESDAVRAT